ncbi:MAG: hypothetical protein NVS3B12_20980 [Acidimicrobiales bacterium]
MGFDDEPEDDRSSAPLLPPDDRLWRHPSEQRLLASPVAPMTTSPISGGVTLERVAESRRRSVALLAGVVGALLTAGVGYATGGVRTRTVPVPALERDLLSPVVTFANAAAPGDFVAGAREVRSSCVVLIAHDPHGMRMSAGVVVRSDGVLLTTAHTVTAAQSITATVGGTRHVGAHIVAVDATSDLAVLKLDGHAYDAAPLGSALDLRVGDPLVVLRPPQGDPMTDVDADVPGDQASVEGLGRDITGPGGTQLADMMAVATTQAPSLVGGPLLDRHGAVIGITMALGPAGRSLEYVTPIDLARAIEQQLLSAGRVVPVWLGVEGVDLTPDRARALGVAGGAVVTKISAGGPAQSAGLRSGDVVVGLDGRVVSSMANLIMALHARQPSTRVELAVNRDGAERTLLAQLAPRP